MWGIAGYDPRPFTSVEELLARHGERLADLTGRRLCRVWSLRFAVDGDRCPTGPLVLDFEGRHLELTMAGFDRLYLSWDRIPLTEPPDIEEQDDPDLAVDWGELDEPELGPVVGGTLREVRVLCNDLRLEHLNGGRVEAWVLGGVEFRFEPGRPALQVFNAPGEAGFANEAVDSPSWRRYDLSGRCVTSGDVQPPGCADIACPG
ncbi:hypothetical protein AB0J86_00530 [Micromonospora sp. NPDC049559]|uniref:hypothetical protein n=1 Tax=Micromonospora sp. NPDC049559 TaxID=3155923 RepID=UPI00341A302D